MHSFSLIKYYEYYINAMMYEYDLLYEYMNMIFLYQYYTFTITLSKYYTLYKYHTLYKYK